MEGNTESASELRAKKLDVSSMTIDDINWYRLHALAITHNSSVEKILAELEMTIESLLPNFRKGTPDARRVEEAFAIKIYLQAHGEEALEQALHKYLINYYQ